MSKAWFVVPSVARYDLDGGQWVEIKEELSYGEQKRMENGGLAGMSGLVEGDSSGSRIDLDMANYEMERLLIWIVDWSATDAKGKSVEITRSAIEALDPDIAEELTDIISAHIEAREDSKNSEAAPSE